MAQSDRRPIKSRETKWARTIATRLATRGISPNQISVASIFMALFAAIALFLMGYATEPLYFGLFSAFAIVGIIARLLCNLFDGMVAVEHGKASKSGMIYNELPDRISDSLILVGAGYATGTDLGITLGFVAALIAVVMSYIRVLTAYAGATMSFAGPMDKSQRMGFLIFGLIAAIIFPHHTSQIILAVLVVMILLMIVGCIRRLSSGLKELR